MGGGGLASRAGDALRQRRAGGRRRRQQREVGRAAVRLLGVVGDHGDARAGTDERTRLEQVEAKRAGADGDDEVVGVERLAQAPAAVVQVAGEQPMVLRESGAGAERLLEDGAAEALGERDRRGPAGGVVGPGAGDERGRGRRVDQVGELGTARRRPPAGR